MGCLDKNNETVTYSCQLFFQAHPGMPQNCHYTEGDWVLLNHYPPVSIGTGKVWWSLLSGNLVFVAGYITLAVEHKAEKKQGTKHMISTWV